MEVTCPRCGRQVGVEGRAQDDAGRVRLPCPGCGAPLLVKVNRPAFKVDGSIAPEQGGTDVPLAAERPGFHGFSIDLGSGEFGVDGLGDEEGERWVVVVRSLPDAGVEPLRRRLARIPRYSRNPNKVHDLTSELPYILRGLDPGEAADVEQTVRLHGGDCSAGPEGDVLDESGDIRRGHEDRLGVFGKADEGLVVSGESDDAEEQPCPADERPGREVADAAPATLDPAGEPGDLLLATGDEGEADDLLLAAGDEGEAGDLLLAAGDEGEAGDLLLATGDDGYVDRQQVATCVGGPAGDPRPPHAAHWDERPLADDDTGSLPGPGGHPGPLPAGPQAASRTSYDDLIAIASDDHLAALQVEIDEEAIAGDLDDPTLRDEYAAALREDAGDDAALLVPEAAETGSSPILVTLDALPDMRIPLGLVSTTIEVPPSAAAGSRSRAVAEMLVAAEANLRQAARERGALAVVAVRTTASDLADGTLIVVMQGTATR